MRNPAVLFILLMLFSGCIQQSGNVYMTYDITECSKEEPTGMSVEKAGDVIYIKQVESYVCCANITLAMNTTGKTIKIYEENVGEMCRCICPFRANIYLYNATDFENIEIYGIKFRDVYGYELMHNYSLLQNISKNESEENKTDEKFCNVDSDCACGVHKISRECFFGNKKYVDETIQCPDFCTGIAGNLEIRCENNMCVQKQKRVIGIPNPASVYCEQNGGKLEIRDFVDGQKGFCIFPDGSECEEWAFYRGECHPGERFCKDMCGDGTCQEVVCMAVGCPCPETPETCPQDCRSSIIAECSSDLDCVHVPSCCHQQSTECVPRFQVKEYPNCDGVACTLECRQCTECRCVGGRCETIPLPIDVCCG
ncbi:MAG: DUF333 domain-containing protein [Candidatus Anstonellales archaeon]